MCMQCFVSPIYFVLQDELCKDGFYDSACLGLINMDWVFKNAYLTSIVQTETCTEVTFASVFANGELHDIHLW